MIRFLADENFNNDIVRGVLRRLPTADLVRAQDVGLSGADDDAVLEWALMENRIVLTHDRATLIGIAYGRVTTGKLVPGVFAASQSAPVPLVIDDLVLIMECSRTEEWAQQVRYLPLR
ncbi:MAG: DUF5615 family PIN-like protein [Myxococcales bacterium]|nr:DUF5615 family PIN-like protein [Myxococcales bacterium]